MTLSPRQEFALLSTEEQARALDLFVQKGGDVRLLERAWRGWYARPEQLAPPGDWRFWYVEAGRGFGKTRLAAQWVHERIELMQRHHSGGVSGQGGLLHRTAGSIREIMIEGPDGLLATAPPGKLPKYEPSKKVVTFHNGYRMICYSAEEPDELRGPTLSTAWADEFATHKGITGIDGLTAFDNLRFALRGKIPRDRPRAVLTTTPKRVKSVRTMHEEAAKPNSNVVITRGSLSDNLENLDEAYVQDILHKYANTALGQQEIEGILVNDVEGSLFKTQTFDDTRITDPSLLPELSKTIIAVDPSAGDGSGDECGIVVLALSAGTLPTTFTHKGLTLVQDLRHLYVLEDASIAAPPDRWARKVSDVAEEYETTTIVAEGNQGYEMVRSVLRNVNKSLRVKIVHAKVGKGVRAQPCAALFAQQRAHLVGEFGDLESECTTWVPGGNAPSPNRLDAMVHGAEHLLPSAGNTTARYDVAGQLSRKVLGT